MPSHNYQHHIAALTTAPVQKQKAGSIHKLLKGPEATTWERSLANEFGRLLPHGVGKTRPPHERIQGTSTIFPIRRADMPPNRTATWNNKVGLLSTLYYLIVPNSLFILSTINTMYTFKRIIKLSKSLVFRNFCGWKLLLHHFQKFFLVKFAQLLGARKRDAEGRKDVILFCK